MHAIFIDSTKACDTTNRIKLHDSLEEYNIPQKIVDLILK